MAIAVVDDLEANVQLQHPAQRIISLAPHITELLYSIDAGDLIVGTMDYSNYPAAALMIPRIGRHNKLDIEKIISLTPDLIIAWHSGSPPADLQTLRRLGFAIYVSEPRHLTDITKTLHDFGILSGNNTAAVIATFKQALEKLQREYAQRQPVSVFYQIWHKPLMTINGQHIISDIIQLCGGRNIFAELPTLAPQVSLEAVIQADPQVIITGDDDNLNLRQQWQPWQQMRAIKHQQLYAIPADIIQRHTLRLLEGASQMCQLLQQARSLYQQP